MHRQIVKDGFGWGFILWLIGYILGILLFMFIPAHLIGWVIMPIGIIITLWVLVKKIKAQALQYFLKIAVIWTLVAIAFDYLFLVKVLKPEDGYYKLDVYLYYLLTFTLPLLVGARVERRKTQ